MRERLIPPADAPPDAIYKADLVVTWGMSAHPGEYIVNLDPNNPRANPDIPDRLVDDLGRRLGENWWTSNRGTRIEICSQPRIGYRDDAFVVSTIANYFAELRELAAIKQ